MSSRIRNHISLADECAQLASEMVIIVSRGLDPKIVKILEREFCQLATENSNGSLLNRQSPKPQKKIDKALQNAIDAFLAESLSILEAMGIWLFSPQTMQKAKSTPSQLDSIELFLGIADGQARGRMEGNKFIVLAGSDVVHEASEGRMSKSLWELRQQLIKSRKIVNFKVQKDVEFGSPSGAGRFVSGHGMNGLDSWKDANKRTLNELKCNTK